MTTLKRKPRKSPGPRRERMPADGRRLPVRSPNAFTRVGLPKRKRRVDMLQQQHDLGQIDDVTFQFARRAQEIYERGNRPVGSSWGDLPGGDVELRKAAAWHRHYGGGDEIRAMEARMIPIIGDEGVKVVRDFLTNEATFASFGAAQGGKSAQLAKIAGAAIFRWLLKRLVARLCTARGPDAGCYRAS
jgi:hypothetical protein